MTRRIAPTWLLPVVAGASLAATHSAASVLRAAAATTSEDTTEAACDLAESIVGRNLRSSIHRSTGSFAHDAFAEAVRGCRLVITGSFENAPPDEDAASRLRDGFAGRGWREMPAYSADGKDGTAFAFRKGEVACLVRGTWDGGSDAEPPVARGHTYRVSVLCPSPAPPEERVSLLESSAAQQGQEHSSGLLPSSGAAADRATARSNRPW